MGYTYEKSPSGDRLFVTGCDESHVQVVAQSGIGGATVPCCVAAEDALEVAGQILGYARVGHPADARWQALKDWLGEQAGRTWPGVEDDVAEAAADVYRAVLAMMADLEAEQ